MATKNKTEPMARATMRLPQALWDAAQHRAIDEHVPVSHVVNTGHAAHHFGTF